MSAPRRNRRGRKNNKNNKNKRQGVREPAVDPSPYAATFSGDDPAAWGWLNVWPFGDKGDVEGDDWPQPPPVSEPVPEPEPEPEPAPEPEPEPEPDPEPASEPEPEPEPAPEPAPEPEPAPVLDRPSRAPAWSLPAGSRRLAALTTMAAVVILVVGGLVWLRSGQGGDDGRIRPVHADSFVAPVELSPATSYVRSRVLPSGDLEVTHWIRSRDAVDSLTVSTPETLGLVSGTVRVSDFVLAVDGSPYPAVSIDEGTPGTRTLRFPMTDTIYLRYRLAGAVQPTGPGGRALARITSLDVSIASELVQTVRTVVGARVLSMACADGPPDAASAPCGSDDGGVWTVRLDKGRLGSRVMARLDLS